jgi:hypothetical protein
MNLFQFNTNETVQLLLFLKTDLFTVKTGSIKEKYHQSGGIACLHH